MAVNKSLIMARKPIKATTLRAQNIVSIGLLKQVHARWACLFLDFRFYLPKKTIEAEFDRVKMKGKTPPFQTKPSQAADMIIEIGEYFSESAILAVTDS